MAFAREALSQIHDTTLVQFSPLYWTAPVGPIEQSRFLNAAASLDTSLEPTELLAELNEIERQSGRQSLADRVKWGPRTLDLDILLFDGLVIDTDDLKVPHPHMHVRRFVLDPLKDIAPDAIHPVLGKSVGQLRAELPEDSG